MVNMLEGGYISEHDYLIGSRKSPTSMCGGDVEARQPGRRAMAARSRAQAFHGAARDGEDAGAHRAHAQDGQAAEELGSYAASWSTYRQEQRTGRSNPDR